MNQESSCNHPLPSRTDLKGGGGFRCDDCKTIIKVVSFGSEPKAKTQTCNLQVSSDAPTAAEGTPKASSSKRSAAATKANKTRRSNKGTVNSINNTNDEKQLARKAEAKQRKEWLQGVESNAKRLVKNIESAKAMVEEAHTLHQKFQTVVRESLPLFENVRYAFAHLRKGESIMGTTDGEAWSQKYLGVTYGNLCRVINKLNGKTSLLLTDGTKVLPPTSEDQTPEMTAFSTETPSNVPEPEEGEEEEGDEKPKTPSKAELEKKVKEQADLLKTARAVNDGQGRQIYAQQSVIETFPAVIKDGNGVVIPPAQWTTQQAIDTIMKFINSVVRWLSKEDVAQVYRSLNMTFEDRLNAAAKAVTEGESVVA